MNIKTLFKGIQVHDIYDNYPDAVIIINSQKNIVFWNKRAQNIFGFSKRDIIGKNIGIIFTDDIGKIHQNLTAAKSSILTAITKTDKEIFIEICCSEANENEEVIIAVRDVTRNQKIIEKLLLEYDKVLTISKNKSNLIASLSHELRSPIHFIIGFGQVLLDGLGGKLTEKQEKYVSLISKNANNLLAFLNNILDLSKIEAGKMEVNIKLFDVAQLINSVTESLNPVMEDKKLNFTVDLTDLVKKNIHSDENLLRQILINVLANAVKFTEMGSINLKVIHPDQDLVSSYNLKIHPEYTDKSFLMFSVTDTGIGIPEDGLETIFDEYRQVDRTISKKYGGTGLGLAITRKILEELGGVIWVESELKQGSTFSFIIPIDKLEQ
ncbi:MAG: ATP-binding protein [Candidatus Gastranaerophilales bacterium]|nr:ATP-binding protein [Candidatus Gastranaerophilales bacterium]